MNESGFFISVCVSIDEDNVKNVGTHVTWCNDGEEDDVNVDDYGEDNNDTGLGDNGKDAKRLVTTPSLIEEDDSDNRSHFNVVKTGLYHYLYIHHQVAGHPRCQLLRSGSFRDWI